MQTVGMEIEAQSRQTAPGQHVERFLGMAETKVVRGGDKGSGGREGEERERKERKERERKERKERERKEEVGRKGLPFI